MSMIQEPLSGNSSMEHTAYSHKRDICFDPAVNQIMVEDGIARFLSDLTLFLKAAGCPLIGHIKGMVETYNQGFLAFSLTSFEEDIHFKGRISGNVKDAVFLLNVIVYGVDQMLIEQEVHRGMEKHFF